MTFSDEIAEGLAAPTDGWSFSWFAGRATEERPGWGYVRRCGDRLGEVDAVLDVDTGGGEVLAEALRRAKHVPGTVRATEGWAPNYMLATAACWHRAARCWSRRSVRGPTVPCTSS